MSSLVRRSTAAVLLTVLALSAAACGSSKSTSTTTGTSSTGGDVAKLSATLKGSGSTFQKAFDEDAIAAFQDVAKGVTVQYAGGGSGQGKKDLADQKVEWAGTDSTIADADKAGFKGGDVLYFPTVAAPITVSYNLAGVDTLKLSPTTLAKIFQGTVTTWNDASIAADNPGVTLPSSPIVVAVRSDASGTTSTFTKYLKGAAPDDWKLDASDTVKWPTSVKSGNGNTGVAQIIHDNAGSIGYVDFADATTAKLSLAEIKNKDGSFVAPTLDGASAALAGATVADNLTYSALNAPGADAYPITAATYVIVYAKQTDANVAAALKGWIGYLLSDGQDLANDAGFAKLPKTIQDQAVAQLDKILVP